MYNIIKKHKITIISILVIVFLCICYTSISYDRNTDTFYFIKLGKDILAHGIDFKDHYSFIQGLPYTYPHWLYSVYIYIIYGNFGFLGIHISNIISYIILILSIYTINIKINKSKFLAFILSIVSIFALNNYIVGRAQVFSIIIMIWEVYFINKLIETGYKKYVVFLSLLSLLLANLHGTIWLMYFILFMPYIGEYIVYNIFKRKNKEELKFGNITIEKIDNIKLVLIAFCISFLMGLLTPSRICYTYLFKTMLGDSQKYLYEHQPLKPIIKPLFIFFVTLLMFYKEKIKLRDFFMIFGIIILALMSVRYLLFFYTIGVLYISKIFMEQLNKNNDNTLNTLENIFFNRKVFLIIMLIFVLLSGIRGINTNSKQKYINEKIYPTKAIKYIKKNLEYKNIKMYNNYGIGGYLLLNDIPVFIDPRCDLYFKEFNNKNLDVFDDSMMLYEKPTSYKKIFKKYGITHVLLGKDDYLYHIIDADNNYKIIYKDKYFTLFKNIKIEK